MSGWILSPFRRPAAIPATRPSAGGFLDAVRDRAGIARLVDRPNGIARADPRLNWVIECRRVDRRRRDRHERGRRSDRAQDEIAGEILLRTGVPDQADGAL